MSTTRIFVVLCLTYLLSTATNYNCSLTNLFPLSHPKMKNPIPSRTRYCRRCFTLCIVDELLSLTMTSVPVCHPTRVETLDLWRTFGAALVGIVCTHRHIARSTLSAARPIVLLGSIVHAATERTRGKSSFRT